MKVGNNGKKRRESKGGGTSGKETSSASNDLSKITPRTIDSLFGFQEKESKDKKVTIEFDYADQDALEYGFYFINAVIATVERLSMEGKDGQIPTDFYYIIAEAGERLDKIRTILGYLR